MTTPAWDGAKLRQLRISRGWTAKQLAAKVGRSPSRIRSYETRHTPPPVIAARIAAALGVDPDQLTTAGSDG